MEKSSHFLIAAQGYLELGMYEDALAELDQLPEQERYGVAVTDAYYFAA